ncbi:hypothetical protein DPMN_098869 [Dreissena polymorpha]|uniref:CCHC-type domain-containing protein n=1 Tax=Dreissena polymorpha TaxID=45954 RepID=A0A9D4LEG3_DREPO|nr:hypothetical protein DPMN_098869 [Dreissena polymorpha]
MGQANRNQEHSGSALMSTERNAPLKQPSKRCTFCDKGHWSDECHQFKTAEERKRRIKGSCFRCLKDNHLANECKSSKICVYCRAKDVHHRSLCDKKFSKSVKKENESAHISQEVEETDGACDESGLLSCDETVFMQTATAKVTGNYSDKSERVRLLLDLYFKGAY